MEILLCEGWNPKSYPCYYINVGDVSSKMVYLRKIGSVEELGKKGEKLDTYKVNQEFKNNHKIYLLLFLVLHKRAF